MPKNSGKKPKHILAAQPTQTGRIERQVSTQDLPPHFSLEHLHPSYGINDCGKDDKAAFAERICELGKMTWASIQASHKHSFGSEIIKTIKLPKPACIGDRAILAFRYSGKKPMVGFRDGRVLNIVWIEQQFGDVYDHGGKHN
jgi:hypothetical protein